MAAATSRPADTDGDGISDARDRCTGTATSQAAAADGCNRDNNIAAVMEGADTCRDTRTDGTGCSIATDIQLPIIHFEFDSARLSAAATASLDEAAETLLKHRDVHIEVAGHTDNRGSSAYNIALSERRARAVRDYLIAKGVTNTLRVRGHGITQPLADNATTDGRARNRRVVLLIVSRDPP